MTSYEEFRKEYDMMHPASVPVPPSDGKANVWMRIGISAMFVCAAMLSGVHTVPTVRAGIEVNELITPTVRDAVALSSFVAVELAILIAGYGVSRNRGVSLVTTVTAFIVAVVANITSVSKALDGGDIGTITVAVVLGVFAPLMALLAGVALVSQRDELKAETAEKWRNYRLELKSHDQQVNAAWAKAQKSDSKPVPVQPPIQRTNSLNERSEQPAREYSVNSPTGYSKQMDARAVIHEWFVQHPEFVGEKLDRLVGLIEEDTGVKVGRTSIHNVRKEIQAARMNGHGEALK